MKIIGELKERVDKAETIEEKKEIFKEAGLELTDEELEQISGGGVIRDFFPNFFC